MTSTSKSNGENKDIKAWTATMNANFKLAKGQQLNYNSMIDNVIKQYRSRWQTYLTTHGILLYTSTCITGTNVVEMSLKARAAVGNSGTGRSVVGGDSTGRSNQKLTPRKNKLVALTNELASEYVLALEDICFMFSYHTALPNFDENKPNVQCDMEHKNIFAYENKMNLLHRVLTKHGDIISLCQEQFHDNLFQLVCLLNTLEDKLTKLTLKTTSLDQTKLEMSNANASASASTTLNTSIKKTDDELVASGKKLLAAIQRKTSSTIVCKYCKSSKFIEFQVTQSRSADEGITTKVFCSAATCKKKPQWILG